MKFCAEPSKTKSKDKKTNNNYVEFFFLLTTLNYYIYSLLTELNIYFLVKDHNNYFIT